MTTGLRAAPGKWISMTPPPPMLPASGCVTARANAVATAASTALPPRAIASRPAIEASAETETTSPRVDVTVGPAAGGAAAARGLAQPATKSNNSGAIETVGMGAIISPRDMPTLRLPSKSGDQILHHPPRHV